jgi:hypothetical protein
MENWSWKQLYDIILRYFLEYTHTHTHTHTYIYIYRERERETKLYIGNLTQFNINCFSGYKFQAQLLVKARELQKDIDI